MTTSSVAKETKVKIAPYAWVILTVLMLVGLAAPLARIKVAPLIPILKEYFDVSFTQAGFLMGMYSFTGILLAIPAGLIIAKIGMKRSGLISAAFVTIGCALGAISKTFNVLLVSRVLEGLSMALVAVVGPAVVAMWFRKERRGVPMAIWSLWVPVGSTLGVNAVPQILKTSTWQAVYWINAVFGLIAFVAFWVFYRSPRPEESGEDRVLSKEEEVAEKANILKSFGEALKIKDVWLIFFCMMCFSLAMGVFQAFGVTYVETVVGATKEQAAFVSSLQFIICLGTAWFFGWLSDRLGTRKKILFVGYVLYLLSLFLFPSLNIGVQTVFFTLLGLTGAIIPPMIFSSMPEAVAEKRTLVAAGMAMIATGQGIGNFVGPTVGGFMADNFGWPWVAYWLVPVFIIAMILTSRLKVR